MSIQSAVRRVIYRFLGLFPEVRAGRAVLNAKNRDIDALESENRSLRASLSDREHALEIMTEARLNADRMVEGIRAQLDALREISEREILSVKQTADWISLECGHRQIFGTAPRLERAPEPENAAPPAPVTARMASRMLTEQFFREAMERAKANEPLPSSPGPEYSSAGRFLGGVVADDTANSTSRAYEPAPAA